MKTTLFTLTIAMLALSAQATIINVPADQPTIQAAIDAAGDGDTLMIAAGTYAGVDSVLNKGLLFMGVGEATVIGTIFAVDTLGPSRVRAFKDLTCDGVIQYYGGVTVETVTVSGGGIKCLDGPISARNCTFSNNSVGISTSWLDFGFDWQRPEAFDSLLSGHGREGITVEDCSFSNNGIGVHPSPNANVTIVNSEFVSNSTAVKCHTDYVAAADVTVSGSSFLSNATALLGNIGASDCVFEDNGIVCVTGFPFGTHLDDCLIQENDVVAMTAVLNSRIEEPDLKSGYSRWVGFNFSDCDVLSNSTILNMGTQDYITEPCFDHVIGVRFAGCTIAENDFGIRLGGCADLSIINCVFESNSDTILAVEGYHEYQDFHRPEIANSVFRDNLSIPIVTLYGDLLVSECEFYDNAGSIVADGARSVEIAGTVIAHNPVGVVCESLYNLKITESTIACNSGNGIEYSNLFDTLQIDRNTLAFNGGLGVSADGSGLNQTISCNDVYDNHAGNWDPSLGDQFGANGNDARDPLFCDSAAYDFSIYNTSPCAPDNNLCHVLIGASSIGCYAPVATLSMDTVYAFMQNAVYPDSIQVKFGGPFDGYTIADIDLPTIRVNDSIPALADSLDTDTDSLFFTISLSDFVASYGVKWGTTMQNFIVNGSFNSGEAFQIPGTFVFRGHVAGDLNLDGMVNVSDLTLLAGTLFVDASSDTGASLDVTGDCRINIMDLTYLVGYLFKDGPAPTGGC